MKRGVPKRLPEGGTGMQNRAEYLLIASMSAFAVTGIAASMLHGSRDRGIEDVPVTSRSRDGGEQGRQDAERWFASMHPYCNAVELEARMSRRPAPQTHEGSMYEAACFALAGRIDRARETIEALPGELRYRAAGVVFEAGHLTADAGDDVAAGPLMELVVDFWPNHYMALYHAGAARYRSGSYGAARSYLERFLQEYANEDGWRSSALSMLQTMAG